MTTSNTGTPIPRLIRIGQSDETERLYQLEEKRAKAIQVAAKELAVVLEHGPEEFWQRTMSQALFDMLETTQKEAALAAAVGFLRSWGMTVSGKATRCVVPGSSLTFTVTDSEVVRD